MTSNKSIDDNIKFTSVEQGVLGIFTSHPNKVISIDKIISDLRNKGYNIQKMRDYGYKLVANVRETGNLSIDFDQKKVEVDRSLVELTQKQYAVMELFMINPNQPIRQDIVYDKAINPGAHCRNTSVVTRTIKSLNNKIKYKINNKRSKLIKKEDLCYVMRNPDALKIGPIVLYRKSKEIFIDRNRVEIRGKAINGILLNLLIYFMEHPGQTFSAQELYDEVWDPNSVSTEPQSGGMTVHVTIGTLRKLIKNKNHELIKSIPQPNRPVQRGEVPLLGYQLTYDKGYIIPILAPSLP